MTVDVVLDTGVSVQVPDNTDLDSEEGYDLIKSLAHEKFLDILQTGYDVDYEKYETTD